MLTLNDFHHELLKLQIAQTQCRWKNELSKVGVTNREGMFYKQESLSTLQWLVIFQLYVILC